MSSTWVVPGAPLEEGKGWRIWYSKPGIADFQPDALDVRLRARVPAYDTEWKLLPASPGVDRRMGVLTVRLHDGAPGEAYTITVPEAGAFTWPTLPASLDPGFTFLMSSCFWLNGDRDGYYAAAVTELTKKLAPAFKLLVGDQLYQDWPVFPGAPKNVLALYTRRYEDYWGDPEYQKALQSSPNFFVCDDHEFWNNFPERQIQLRWTWRENDRVECARIARELYSLYQAGSNPDGGTYFDFKVDNVSFFVSDSRSRRTPVEASPPHFFLEDQWDRLEQWVGALSGPGVLVLSQPLFQKEGKRRTDYSLCNFAQDQARLCAVFERAVLGETGDGRPHDILVLTGDIHTGRHCVGTIDGVLDAEVHEFVASPASLVAGGLQVFRKASSPPGKLQPADRRPWKIEQTKTDHSPTTDNNVASVRVVPGTNGRIRFELELWRVPTSRAPFTSLFKKEIQLR